MSVQQNHFTKMFLLYLIFYLWYFVEYNMHIIYVIWFVYEYAVRIGPCCLFWNAVDQFCVRLFKCQSSFLIWRFVVEMHSVDVMLMEWQK